MDIGDVGKYFTSTTFLASATVIIITCILLVVIKKYLIKKVAYTTNKDQQHKNTFIGIIFNLLQYAVILGCAVIVLKLNGVNVGSIVAGLGIVGALVGLALQDTMKDIISGVNIYNNNFYKVGDMVMYDGQLCEVKYFSARVTKFSSMYTGNTFTVCNSMISAIEKVKNNSLLLLSFNYDDDKDVVDECFRAAIEESLKVPYINDIEYYGMMDLNKDGFTFVCKIIAGHKVLEAKGVLVSNLYYEFKKHNIAPSFDEERKITFMNNPANL